jgi:hypothetical protein
MPLSKIRTSELVYGPDDDGQGTWTVNGLAELVSQMREDGAPEDAVIVWSNKSSNITVSWTQSG